MKMAISILLVFLLLTLSFPYSSSSSSKVFSLSVGKPEDIIHSKNLMFSAGFHPFGENAFCFAVWFTQHHNQIQKRTVVWMANRDQPVNGIRSMLLLLKTGNLILTDAGQSHVWTTNTASSASVELVLNDTGNLVLLETQGSILWQSFDFPTDTLLPGQHLTRYKNLVSSRSESNYSSGFYKLFFNDENILSLLYDGPDISSVYWPNPWSLNWVNGRSTYNSSRVAALNIFGNFSSSDDYHFMTSDYGSVLQRRLTLDYDGNLRVYSRKHEDDKWYVSWQAKSHSCRTDGICGANSTCSYDPIHGRKCSCLPRYRVKNHTDWSYGCEPMFHLSCNQNESKFMLIQDVEFYGYDFMYTDNSTYGECEKICLESCNCKGFQHTFDEKEGHFKCFPKTQLLNGYRSPSFEGTTYLRFPKSSNFSGEQSVTVKECIHANHVTIDRVYLKRHENNFVKFFLWFLSTLGAFEIICIILVPFFLIGTRKKFSADDQSYHLAPTGFKKFTYSELKEATREFSQEIGRGAGGTVYKGVLSDHRVAAIKRLNEANQGEGEFLAEVSIIGRLNHMNLIEMWGYCAEGKHRLLVYEYMENGSLAENLLSNTLDWNKRYNIALGMARGLAYLHEECLEWILHCDIKPQNILLDSNYQPKVADFRLSKLLNRNNLKNSSFSKIRGTRGYMAPEWVYNLPITSKVDVYSYGIVVLEMITGKSPTSGTQTFDGVEEHHGRLVTWVREKRSKTSETASWVEQITNPMIGPNYNVRKMEILAQVALDCIEEVKDARPTMSQVHEMLQSQEND